jgi:hypothetical protein
VLKSAAEKNPVDRQFIMDVTKTIEELTELGIDKTEPWDPRLGGALRKIEEAETKLGIPRRRKKKRVAEPTKKGLIERMKFWKKSY